MKTLSLTEVKAKLSELVDEVESHDERIVITRRGRPAAVLVSQDDFDSWQETLEIRSDRRLTLVEERRSPPAGLPHEDGYRRRPPPPHVSDHRTRRAPPPPAKHRQLGAHVRRASVPLRSAPPRTAALPPRNRPMPLAPRARRRGLSR